MIRTTYSFCLAIVMIMLNGCAGGGGNNSGGNGGGPPASNTPFWAQWGANPQHTGLVNVNGQNTAHKLADIVYDPFVLQEQAENLGPEGQAVLTAHYPAPLVDGNDVYMLIKSGAYNSCNPAGSWANPPNPPTPTPQCGPNTGNTQVWNVARFTFENGSLTQIWSFQSDWKPEINGGALFGWEPVFHAVDANDFIYVPGGGGTVFKVDKNKGTAVSHINPFSGMAGFNPANAFVSGPLTVDAQGNIYYNAIELVDPKGGLVDPWQSDVVGSWLVRITPQDGSSMVTYSALVPNAPPANSNNCPGTFAGDFPADPLPWPPSTSAAPQTTLCGSQRPAVNVAPAIAPDGTIYTASRAHFDGMEAFLIAVNPNLTSKWSASFQNLLNDGCGILVPIGPTNTTPNACRVGSNQGVDPTTNAAGSGFISDQGSSSPTVLPDGSVLFGAITFYNALRGHLFHFDAQGHFLNAFDFGWDSTPGVFTHNGTFSVVIKDNHYNVPLYCFFNNPICQTLPAGPYFVTQLNPSMQVEWKFQNTTVNLPNNPNGFEWCVNMPAIDANGQVYANSEDGNLYAIPQGHSGIFTTPSSVLFLKEALGAAYTPLSIGPDGKFYAQNDGHLFVVGN